MNNGAIVLIFVVVIALAIAAGVYGYQANKKRQAAFAAWASQHGFTYATQDNRYRDLPWGAPFGRGTGRQALDVLTGTYGNHPTLCFTLRFQTTSSNGKTTTTETHYYAIYSLHLPRPLPGLRVGPEGFFSGIARMVGVHDIEFESEDFNRAYKVQAGDRKFASDVINPQMMEFLTSGSAPGFTIIDSDLIWIDRGRLEPATIESRLTYLAGVLAHVPDFVWKQA